MRAAEVERTLAKTEMSDADRARVEAMTSAIVKKLLHAPIAKLKEPGEGERYVQAARSLFALDERRRTARRTTRRAGMSRTFVIGARRSQLSLRQVDIVVTALLAAHPGVHTEFHEIVTQGDASAAPLSQIGGLGVFTKAIEDALLAGEIDIAVHSLKDLPPVLPDGLVLAAVPPRGDVRDALVTRGVRPLAALRKGARIGTGSARRAVQLKALRPDLEIADIRGNVPTRMAKVESSSTTPWCWRWRAGAADAGGEGGAHLQHRRDDAGGGAGRAGGRGARRRRRGARAGERDRR